MRHGCRLFSCYVLVSSRAGVARGAGGIIDARSGDHDTKGNRWPASANALSQDNLIFTTGAVTNVEAAAVMGMLPAIKKHGNRSNALLEEQEIATTGADFLRRLQKHSGWQYSRRRLLLARSWFCSRKSRRDIDCGLDLDRQGAPAHRACSGLWKGFTDARGQYQRLKALFEATDWAIDRMPYQH